MPARLVINADLGPFNAAYQAGRHVARSADGTWFYAVQDSINGRVLWQSHNGLVDIPLSPQPTMRPTFYADPSGLYCCAGLDGDKKHLLIWYIDDYKTVYPAATTNDPRVDALISQFATLTQQVTRIETVLGSVSMGDTLSAEDMEVLRRLKVLLLG